MVLASETEVTRFCSARPSSWGSRELAYLLRYEEKGMGLLHEYFQGLSYFTSRLLISSWPMAGVACDSGECQGKAAWQRVWLQERRRTERALQSDHPRPSVRTAG